MDRPARWWRVAKCTERRCGRVEEGYTRSTFADVDDIDLRDPKIGNIHTCKWCEWLAENRAPSPAPRRSRTGYGSIY